MQKVTRWGNSCGVRIPAAILQSAGIKPGDYVTIRLMDSGDLRVRPVTKLAAAEPMVAPVFRSQW